MILIEGADRLFSEGVVIGREAKGAIWEVFPANFSNDRAGMG
jgi:hypothetical protein